MCFAEGERNGTRLRDVAVMNHSVALADASGHSTANESFTAADTPASNPLVLVGDVGPSLGGAKTSDGGSNATNGESSSVANTMVAASSGRAPNNASAPAPSAASDDHAPSNASDVAPSAVLNNRAPSNSSDNAPSAASDGRHGPVASTLRPTWLASWPPSWFPTVRNGSADGTDVPVEDAAWRPRNRERPASDEAGGVIDGALDNDAEGSNADVPSDGVSNADASGALGALGALHSTVRNVTESDPLPLRSQNSSAVLENSTAEPSMDGTIRAKGSTSCDRIMARGECKAQEPDCQYDTQYGCRAALHANRTSGNVWSFNSSEAAPALPVGHTGHDRMSEKPSVVADNALGLSSHADGPNSRPPASLIELPAGSNVSLVPMNPPSEASSASSPIVSPVSAHPSESPKTESPSESPKTESPSEAQSEAPESASSSQSSLSPLRESKSVPEACANAATDRECFELHDAFEASDTLGGLGALARVGPLCDARPTWGS